jgi:hypothetical protein
VPRVPGARRVWQLRGGRPLRQFIAANPVAKGGDLAANKDNRCTLAYMRHPRFSSGEEHGSTPEVTPLWDALYAALA